jgi:crossover junction endodeoxyribonuclease RuvC
MRVLAIDPGYGRCGVAVLEHATPKPTLIHSACIETSTESEFSERLHAVGNEVERLITHYHPNLIALEELFFTNNAKTAIKVAEVRGMLLYIAEKEGLPVKEWNPLAIKVAITGYGRATKEQVTKMTGLMIDIPKRRILDDEFDAIALGITALAESRGVL